jgi:hypothetical protein
LQSLPSTTQMPSRILFTPAGASLRDKHMIQKGKARLVPDPSQLAASQDCTM